MDGSITELQLVARTADGERAWFVIGGTKSKLKPLLSVLHQATGLPVSKVRVDAQGRAAVSVMA